LDRTNLFKKPSRRSTFEANYGLVESHNTDEAANGGQGFTLGINKYSDLTTDEFTAMNGYLFEEDEPQAQLFRPVMRCVPHFSLFHKILRISNNK
jgi:hypothetical protein